MAKDHKNFEKAQPKLLQQVVKRDHAETSDAVEHQKKVKAEIFLEVYSALFVPVTPLLWLYLNYFFLL